MKTGNDTLLSQENRAGGSASVLWILAPAVAIIVIAIHWPVLSAQAITFDDQQYLIDNRLTKNPSLDSMEQFFGEVLEPSTVGGYYQPLAMVSLMVDYAFARNVRDLRTFHRTSLLLHAANTSLIVVLLYVLFGHVWIAALVGLLFGVHPLTIEPIAWVSDRKTLLAGCFSLLCLIFYVRYTRRAGWISYGVSILMYILALLSKPTSLPVPVLLLLLDYWPLRRLNKRAILEKIPFFVFAGLSAVVTIISQSRTARAEMPSDYPATRIPLILCHNIIFYLYKIFWPTNVSSHYAMPKSLSASQPRVLAGIIGTCLLIPALVLSLRWTRALMTGWLFFFVAIFPTMGIIGFTIVIAADKYAYLPGIGLLLPMAWFLSRFWKAPATRVPLIVSRGVTCIILLVLAGLLALTTRRYLVKWHDTVTLSKYMISLAPDVAELHNGLGWALAEEKRFPEAVESYDRALQLDPDSPLYHNNLAIALSDTGRMSESVKEFKRAVEIQPAYATAYRNMGIALATHNRAYEAAEAFREFIRLKPNVADGHKNLGMMLVIMNKPSEAMDEFRKAIEIKPNQSDSHKMMGRLLAKQGKIDEAIDEFQKALRSRPLDLAVRDELGTCLAEKGRFDEAIREWQIILQINPFHPKARERILRAEAKRGAVH